MSALYTALLEAQQKAPPIPKTAENSAFGGKSKYVSLDTLLELLVPVLNAAGLVLTQQPTHVDGQPALRTRIVHGESGEADESVMLLMLSKSDPQGQGSAITYARRYSLMAVLGLSADADDDGNAASRRRQDAPPKAAEDAMASDESIQHVRDLAKKAGFGDDVITSAIAKEVEENGGVRQSWVDVQRDTLATLTPAAVPA